MVITVLRDKYRCGSNFGFSAIEKEDLLKKLNSVIEWDKCVFPKELKKDGNPDETKDWEENKKFLGENPELKPGDMFGYDGQIIAVDRDDRLVLCITETGIGALNRIYDDIISMEFTWKNNTNVSKVLSVVESCNTDNYTEQVKIPYSVMRHWKEKVFKNKWKEGDAVKFEFEDNNFFYPVNIVFKDWEICYNPEEVFSEVSENTVIDIMSWCWNNY